MDDRFLVADRYAYALFDAARDVMDVERLWEEVSLLSWICDNVSQFLYWMSVPVLPLEEKKRFIDEVAEKIGWGDLMVSFLRVLIEKKRFSLLPYICKKVRLYYNLHHHRIDVRLISARPLTDEEKERFLQIWGGYLGKWINLIEEVDSSLIGGIKVRWQSMVYDGSIQGRLGMLKKELAR